MQNKGLIKLFAVLFGLVSLYQLSFTFFANKVEDSAKVYAKENAKGNSGRELAKFERKYLDSVANDQVVNLGIGKYSYNDIKEREMNLGLDLKGGINAILQVSVKDILIALANNSENTVFRSALAKANEAQKDSQENYLDLFLTQFETLSNGSIKLSDPAIFGTKSLREKIDFNKTNAQVKEVLQQEINSSINTSFEVLRSRIDKFGVTQPNIQRIGNSGRIQIELPGAKDIERVTKLITSTAELQFWEVYTNAEVQNFFFSANAKVAELLKDDSITATTQVKDSAKADDIDDLLGESTDAAAKANTQKNLFTYLYPNVAQNQQQMSSLVAQAKVQDTAQVNSLLAHKSVQALLPANLKYVKFLWDYKAQKSADGTAEIIGLYAIKSNRNDKATIDGDVISDANQDFDQLSKPVVSMTMNASGTKKWAKMTGDNVGKFVAVVLDNYVYTAPVVNGAITGGSTQISGGTMTVEEAQDISTVLKAGKLPAPARIIQAEVVGPSLGQESINASIWSFGLAILLILGWMFLYYGKAGIYANIALLVNILFIFGWLASYNAVLTLPGIAGIILTIGMSVDANVIIFERIKEALRGGQTLETAVDEGFSFKGALSAIIDANITTFLTGVILFIFGTGPIKGFAYTLMLGIATSLFTAIFITRLFIDKSIEKGTGLPFNTSISKNWFQNINIEFLKKRKLAYIISGFFILAGLVSIFTLGLKQGVDFKGGRSYVVRFDQPMNATQVATSLKDAFKSAPEVKTYGSDHQLKITTAFKIDEDGSEVDQVVQKSLFTGLKAYLGTTSYEDFKPGFEKAGSGIMSYMKVEPTIADDIKKSALWAVIGSLIVVFLYILLRFRKIAFSIGAVVAVFHDVLVVLGVFSICYKFMPFDMEIGQSFIAAILTVVGYSLNDTVVIFDRIREFTQEKTTISASLVNKALNSTLGRTINTSLTTLLVMLAIFFFGGDSIKGFMFALIVGVVVGTYSSLFVATPIMFDASKKAEAVTEQEENQEIA
ncbi:protein translocase subunit SecDF [Tenacibaculum finnmarkense genomovar finnmarkense]|uniref:protein translocase subunit SecDF n=2 Tax=Tenacibaculum finnmarkense TaxID=2781243 RepID=UPI001E48E963|nr:protein translocase subunit SecDF [Tenacibaculum finnmarkense]MCD8416280.1 protein translocase subunit SecDF [Tenacibaculum finnmarkense genomovar finnmarkense]MCG8184940.1 protein translocase subunit SecDF [Tenacibaculum finnmarkense genomovar finnmarkense]MCG8201226.1 protein translocase subunit SecDF [Tenacibaculum finnmarkense genomovar finnmarkense]MCG8208899.1 protein translocase subunit SecDF [Tenacibaculum finnmarkense genomovar finnmarkense]MCG8211786.1 protein translocase subunit 